ncbi:hypothetical protein RJ640_014126 [Escallonia rubra]|uniref:Uncharacterized protein n=1 Tax=Escallonia rubra TaxID=112253 RepID=A0AA88QFY8_9ASTE|nr:hypothetical protein RJ640_014126 [Escallonia rubra]
MALQLSETLKETITVYTGLSPPTLFILVALGLPIYYVVSDMFGSSSSHHQRSWDFEEEMQPLPPFEEALKAYDGSDTKKPLLMATKVQICDLSQSR